MVVAQHVTAAEIGVEVMQRGGNAVDAAITTAFASGVLLPIWNGIGGGGVMKKLVNIINMSVLTMGVDLL